MHRKRNSAAAQENEDGATTDCHIEKKGMESAPAIWLLRQFDMFCGRVARRIICIRTQPIVLFAMSALRRFLVIDDDAVFRRTLSRALIRRGYEVFCAATPMEALDSALHSSPGWVVLDLNLDGQSGLALLPKLQALNPRMRILVLTGYANIQTAVDAIKLGARHYLAKPAAVDEVLRELGVCAAEAAGTDAASDNPGARQIRELEWTHIRSQLVAHGGNISATAKALKMNLRTLQRKIARYRGTAKEIRLDRIRARCRRRGNAVAKPTSAA